ncbi:MAG TPA: NTP transferase domain-containing protein [Amnibacterium sp.]|jgi:molybdopterin-guanine dinucleotide biosynthesis protein A|uniref:molybdenum cofactor guanylyltransferase n=1 Tax=Amnibacterium sp. TaxID=1872496 RepID=UPI002F9505D1
MMQWNAIILAGGRSVRLGGIDKCAIEVRGRRLLDAALAATEGAAARVIVGPERRWARDVPRVLEEPRYGGTQVAVDAGLRALADTPEQLTAVLAADQPRVDDALAELMKEVRPQAPVDGWVAMDYGGNRHPLLAVYRTEALRHALAAELAEAGRLGRRMQGLLPRLAMRPVQLLGYLCADIDTEVELIEHGVDPERVLPKERLRQTW